MTDLTIPKNLVEQLCKGNCVLFVGAGISTGEGGLPGGWQLAQELARRCEYPGDDLSLPRVAQYYADTIDKADLLKYVCQRIREARREPMETHKLIAALPLKIIVSTNYDCLIERALEAAGRPFNVIVTDKQVSSWQEGVVNLLKIHGCVSQWESIVITKDDYWEFFERRPNIANILSAEAARRSLLFVGHGLGDDDFNRLSVLPRPRDLNAESAEGRRAREGVPRIPHFRASAIQRFERGKRGGTEGAERGSAYSALPSFRDPKV